MGFRATVRITLIVSFILLCIGMAFSFYIRITTTEKAEEFDLYTLIPSNPIAIVDTDDMVNLIQKINELTPSKDHSFLHASALFAHLKNHINSILDDTPHGLSRHMNKMLISFHLPDDIYNQVIYCRLGSGDYELVEKFIGKYFKSPFSPKKFEYSGEEIRIFPLPDDNFLSCYLTPEFLAVSYRKKLIEEVIDARQGKQTIMNDPVFSTIRKQKKQPDQLLYM